MKYRVLVFVFVILITVSQLAAQSYAKVNINNVSTFVWNDGRMDIAPNGNSGFEYWKRTKRFFVFTSGVYWGGYIDNVIRVGGTRYKTSLFSGNENGNASIYRIRPDYLKANLSNEINDENLSESEIRMKYETDYTKWPVSLGAPYNDIDKDGMFTQGKDIPGFPNADQTLWLVCNDFDILREEGLVNPFYSKQTDIELQITVWAYSNDTFLKGVVFKNYKLINKSKTKTIKDMYLGIYSDSDIGDGVSDFAGCDTVLGLGYIYNSEDYDRVWKQNLGAYGCLLLQSPIIDAPHDNFAVKGGKKIYNKKNLGMSSFSINPVTQAYIDDPSAWNRASNYYNYYNYLKCLEFVEGYPTYDLITRKTTNFPLSGDPVNKTGFIDGFVNIASDRRIQLNSGPFNMAPGDTQEVIFAQIVTNSTSRLGSVSYLKYLAKYVKDFYENGMFPKTTDINTGTELPTHFSLEQNYPNPFNPKTNIVYELPVAQNVSISVFNSLGEKISTLVNEFKEPGRYTVEFDGTNLSSGVYFYYLEAGEYIKTKKMILLK